MCATPKGSSWDAHSHVSESTVLHAKLRWSQSWFGLTESLEQETDVHTFFTQHSEDASGLNSEVRREHSRAMVDKDAWVVLDIGPVDVHALTDCRRGVVCAGRH
jgi:hypothetical protein